MGVKKVVGCAAVQRNGGAARTTTTTTEVETKNNRIPTGHVTTARLKRRSRERERERERDGRARYKLSLSPFSCVLLLPYVAHVSAESNGLILNRSNTGCHWMSLDVTGCHWMSLDC